MAKHPRVLLKDIAELANCSVAAVSRAMSNDVLQHKLVAPDTFENIRKAAQTLNYRPRRSQMHRSQGIVGVFVPQLQSNLTLNLIHGINAVANEANTPLYFYTFWDSGCFDHFINHHPPGNHAMGVLSYYPMSESEVPGFMAMYEKLRQHSVPMVIMHNDAPPDFPEVTVRFDNLYGGKLAGRHLRMLQCREYFILGSSSSKISNTQHYSQERLQGCYNELTFNSRTICHMLTNNQGYGITNKQGLIESLYRMVDWKQPGSVGIFCDSDRLAAHLLTFLQSKQIHIGSQVKIMGYNGEDFTSNIYPSLTTVKQDFYKLGSIAMQKLFNMMKGKNEKSAVVKPELIVRSST